MNEIIIITGFSASGKDTLANNLAKEGAHFVLLPAALITMV